MRKTEREVANFDDQIDILDRCECIRVGFNDSPYPYVVPLSFGYKVEEKKLTLYFHCAPVGRKIELIEKDPNVCVEADVVKLFNGDERGISCDFDSVICNGKVVEIKGEEALKGLNLILRHCGYPEREFKESVLDNMKMFRIDIEEMSGKRRNNDNIH